MQLQPKNTELHVQDSFSWNGPSMFIKGKLLSVKMFSIEVPTCKICHWSIDRPWMRPSNKSYFLPRLKS